MANEARGIYDISVYGRLVRVRVRGDWNHPTFQGFKQEYKSTVEALGDGAWAVVFDIRDWKLTDPTALDDVDDLAEWPAPQGPGPHVILFDEMDVQEALISRTLSLAAHDTYYFTQPEEVADWLAKHPEYYSESGATIDSMLESVLGGQAG